MSTTVGHRFSVHPRRLAGRHARVVVEASFEAAAIAFIEDFAPAPEDGADVSILVRDLETGVEHCFLVDLESGETSPCA
jgi:hypothetical protein